ncbi:Crp/Fnr family transcriptional regulator [Butyrivibrio sp. WCD3002]|uniref:Crp/Fnr family transcriptional regulator n=1 Tax=Butyrivibrio sp. WCD3002 TaxID=1280676 RepID=UPI0004115EA2|nr:Crp/Fnr family transcriptional regulator [Butyrivibrio sp. WCD3002]
MDIDVLQKIPLFRGMTENEISALLKSLDAKKQNYKKNDLILHAGSKPGVIGIVLSGSVTILSDDIWGNRTILSHVEKDGIFAEAYALLEDVPMLVDVMANEGCSILMLKTKGILNSVVSQNSWDYKFLRNLLLISSKKNLNLSGRSFHTSPKTIRERVMSYLNTLSLQNDSSEFDIPFDRQQLADYLNLERSALSKELGKMQKEGIIETRKSHFKLLTP